ncbi:hypothetical protein LSTR_LSTR010591 [Laodelphax striatellus]|uniref:Uncharacterized protein n=1 Tax=Laodelphax striatellus TaxID=195883 RepID=A0A482XJE4_LAOST|nr:hypothetical protein LSTR_LSTR010591 [Laodelphax striatellus]
MEKRTIYTILSYVEWIIALLLFTIHYLSFHASGKYEFFFVTSIYGGFHLVIFTKIYLQAVKEDEEEITGPSMNRTHPIIASFAINGKKTLMLTKAKALKGSRVHVSHDYDRETKVAKLREINRRLNGNGKSSRLKGVGLMVEGKFFGFEDVKNMMERNEWNLFFASFLLIEHYKSFHASEKFELFFVTIIYGGCLFMLVTLSLQDMEEEGGDENRYIVVAILGAVMYTVCAIFTFKTSLSTNSDEWECDDDGMFDANSKRARLLSKAILSTVEAVIFLFDALFKIINRSIVR